MITVRVVGYDKVVKDINAITVKLPKEMIAASQEFGQSLQRRMRREITARRLIWTGRLHDRTEWRQQGNTGILFMPRYGVALDRMRPHWVKLKRGRLIRQWAYEKGNYFVRAAATAQRSIYVKPKHFIQGPVDRTIADLPKILRRHLDKAVNER